MTIQFKKGVLELCVLALLDSRDRYGYEIAASLTKGIDISDGTVYPVLRRLQQDEYLTSYLCESQGGAPRKYYTLTPKGKEFLSLLMEEWRRFSAQVDSIIHGGEESE